MCESPLTFQAITIWRDELLNEDILLRDVIDLEATFGRSLDGEEDLEGGPALEDIDISASAPRRAANASEEPELDADGEPDQRAPMMMMKTTKAAQHLPRRDGSRPQAPRP